MWGSPSGLPPGFRPALPGCRERLPILHKICVNGSPAEADIGRRVCPNLALFHLRLRRPAQDDHRLSKYFYR